MHSNIIGFNPLLAELPTSPTRTFRKELEHYLQRYPDTEQLDIYLHDLNGQLRGKRLPIAEAFGLEKGCYFPLSIYALDLHGRVIEESGLGQRAGSRIGCACRCPARCALRAIPNATPSCC